MSGERLYGHAGGTSAHGSHGRTHAEEGRVLFPVSHRRSLFSCGAGAFSMEGGTAWLERHRSVRGVPAHRCCFYRRCDIVFLNSHYPEASFTKNTSPAAIIFRSAIILFPWVCQCHRQFLGQKIIAAGDLFLGNWPQVNKYTDWVSRWCFIQNRSVEMTRFRAQCDVELRISNMVDMGWHAVPVFSTILNFENMNDRCPNV